jgi:ArsR family transcriptional regulator
MTPEMAGTTETTTTQVTTTEAQRDRSAVIARALADPKRLCVLELLADGGERSVGDLSRCVGCQVPNMSQHLAVLRSAGIVASRRQGSTVLYRIAEPSVLDLVGALSRVS